MIDQTPRIRLLHATLCRASGRAEPLTMQKIFAWESWLSQGWTEADLQMVVKAVRQKVDRRERQESALTFRRIIGDVEFFGEELAACRARAREHRIPIHKAQVLACTGRSVEIDHPAKPVGDVMRGNAALAELLKVRDAL